jgi:hypothetical protein
MFNYNRRNFSTTPTSASPLSSPFNDPITNARFFALGGTYSTGKWSHEVEGIYATALQAADGVNAYYNNWDGYYKNAVGTTAQDKGLGFELDYTLGYQWDESMHLGVQTGLLIPGKFYEFSNSAIKNNLKTVFASSLNLSVKF